MQKKRSFIDPIVGKCTIYSHNITHFAWLMENTTLPKLVSRSLCCFPEYSKIIVDFASHFDHLTGVICGRHTVLDTQRQKIDSG